MDAEGLGADHEHMMRVHRVRDVATWLALPYEQMAQPKKHTRLSAVDPALSGAGELWLLRVPAELDLAALDNATFDWPGSLPDSLAVALDATALAKSVNLVADDADSAARSSSMCLTSRAPESAAAFKCAYPTKAMNADTGQDVHFLRFGPAFDRAFTLHRKADVGTGAPPLLDPVVDDAFLNVRHRVPPVSRKQLQHKFAPIGANASLKEKHRSKKSSSSGGKSDQASHKEDKTSVSKSAKSSSKKSKEKKTT
jgi:hypothetical protein